MLITLNSENTIKEKFNQLSFCLNERSRRLWAATEAKSYGWGGISIVSRATEIDRKTINTGIKELDSVDKLEANRIRKKGAGRKNIKETYPSIIKDLELLIEPVTLGDPESPLRWTSKSTYKLADELTNKGSKISQRTICDLLQDMDYSLQANKKTNEGGNNPDRNAQFEYINEKAKGFQKKNQPIISVDTKKKENIGNFKNNGKEYSKKGDPKKVNTYDFVDKKLGKVAP